MARKCYNHPQNNALGNCHYCGRFLCSACLIKKEGNYYCQNPYNCLAFQEKGSDIHLETLKEETATKVLEKKTQSEGEAVQRVTIEKRDYPGALDHRAVKRQKKSNYLSLLRRPQGLRAAVVMAEILGRPRFRRR